MGAESPMEINTADTGWESGVLGNMRGEIKNIRLGNFKNNTEIFAAEAALEQVEAAMAADNQTPDALKTLAESSQLADGRYAKLREIMQGSA